MKKTRLKILDVLAAQVVLLLTLSVSCSRNSPLNQSLEKDGSHPPTTKQQSRIVQSNDVPINNQEQPISKDQAIAIANKAAADKRQTISPDKIVSCETSRFWIIIYDGSRSEYYINKFSGRVLGAQNVPQSATESANDTGKQKIENVTLSSIQATSIARSDFIKTYGEQANLFEPYACEMSHAWRVFFEIKMTPNQNLATRPNADPPNYVIDKNSGEIIYRQTIN